jgi:hypothetical protein
MVDGTIITIIPPILASILTYAIATKRSKLTQLKTISEIQSKAIELVQKAEEQMRTELRKEIELIKEENSTLRQKISILESQRNASDRLSETLREEISALRTTVEHYKQIIDDNKITMTANKREVDANKREVDANKRETDADKKEADRRYDIVEDSKKNKKLKE